MSVHIPINLSREFEVRAAPLVVHALLADVPRSAAHFPDLRQLVPLGDNTYRWEMDKHGIAGIALQTVYACRYRSDPETLRVWWEPVEGVGNARVAGQWQLAATPGGTLVRFELEAQFDLPLPHLIERMADGVVYRELQHLVDEYIHKLHTALES